MRLIVMLEVHDLPPVPKVDPATGEHVLDPSTGEWLVDDTGAFVLDANGQKQKDPSTQQALLEVVEQTGNAVFRFPVPAGREYLYAGAGTAAPPDPDATKQQQELDDLTVGRYFEHHVSGARLPKAWPDKVKQQALEQAYTDAKAAWETSETSRLSYYGSSWDGAGWNVTSA